LDRPLLAAPNNKNIAELMSTKMLARCWPFPPALALFSRLTSSVLKR
jgi:hypothetical protein